MSDLVRRRSDRTGGEDWPYSTVNRGIEHRISMAGPGEEISFREGTGQILFDQITEVTWEKVLAILVQIGWLERVSQNTYRKAMETPLERDVVVRIAGAILPILQQEEDALLNSLEITKSRSDLQTFILFHLQRYERDSHINYKIPSLKNILPKLTERLTVNLFPRLPVRREVERGSLYQEAFAIIRDYFEETLEWSVGDAMIRSWACVVHDIYHHSQRKRA